MKKVLSVLLIAMLLCGICVTALAYDYAQVYWIKGAAGTYSSGGTYYSKTQSGQKWHAYLDSSQDWPVKCYLWKKGDGVASNTNTLAENRDYAINFYAGKATVGAQYKMVMISTKASSAEREYIVDYDLW